MSERWLPVQGREDRYQVSDQGRVLSLGANCVLRPAVSGNGYAVVTLHSGPGRRVVYVHRLVLEMFVGRCPDGMEACHGSGGRLDNRLDNLRWDTKSANSHDSVRDGVHPMARKTHCRRNHLLDGPNLRVRNGTRQCLACHNARSAITRRGFGEMGQLADEYYGKIMRNEDGTTVFQRYQQNQLLLESGSGVPR